MLERLHHAKEQLAEVEQNKSQSRDKNRRLKTAKVSLTDPESRVMRLANGAIAPAYNLQLAAVGDPQGGPVAVVGVLVTQQGNDKNQLMPMRQQLEHNLGHPPRQVVVDAGFPSFEELLAAKNVDFQVIAPVPQTWQQNTTSKKVEGIELWKQQMAQPAAKATYPGRKAIIERLNARVRQAGLGQLPVRGLRKVLGFVTLLGAMITLLELGPRWLGWSKVLPSGVESGEAPPQQNPGILSKSKARDG